MESAGRDGNKRSSWERTREYWWNFCRQTPIHGMKYLAELERPIYERLWWAGILLTCLYFSYVYSIQLWNRLNVLPNDQMIETRIKYLEVFNVPSPAITFCDNMKSTSINETNEMTGYVCGQGYDNHAEDSPQLDMEALIKMAPVFNVSCRITHGYKEVNNVQSYCDTMLTRTLTQHGVCYTFNMMDVNEILTSHMKSYHSSHGRQSDWSPERGYRQGTPLMDRNGSSDLLKEGAYPKRANGWMVSFNISLRSAGTFCAQDQPGLKVALHNPAGLPRMGHRDNVWFPAQKEDYSKIHGDFMELKSGHEHYIDVDPEMNLSAENMRRVQPQQRACYFSDEESLKYFRYYTKTNCENECLINTTLERCGCVDFYMPHENHTRLCKTKDLDCMLDALDFWKKVGAKLCHCYSSCKELKYNTQLFYKSNVGAKIKVANGSVILTTYTWDYKYMSREQRMADRKYFLVDFIANCGGVFGLFCGMSIISIIDITYYGTIRLISNVVYRKEKDRQQNNDVPFQPDST